MNSKLRLALKGVRKLQPYQPGKPIAELEREYGIRAAIKLASNENPLGAGKLARDAISTAGEDIGRYPDGNGFGLKRALSKHLDLAPERITLGNGSNDVLEIIARTFASTRDEVVYSQYAFAVYPIVVQAIGARAVVVPARDWGHDLEAMAAAITPKTRLVFIANPNNPTGTWVDRRALERFVTGLPDHVVVVVDEAYSEYILEPEYPNALDWLERNTNLIVCRTFSKIHGLAGLRVGYAVSSPEIADLLNRVRQPFNVNSIGLAAAEAALFDGEHVQRSVDINQMGLRQIGEALDAYGIPYIPSVGNFIALDVARPGAEIFDRLLHQGVIVRPIANYGMPNHLRVTVGLERENRRFLTSLQRVLEDGT